MKTRLAVNGAGGRMGRRLMALALADPAVVLAAALEGPNYADLGRDAGEVAGVGPAGVKMAAELAHDARIDAMVDFSHPAGTMAILPVCTGRKIPIVVATTGHTAEQRRAVEEAAHETAVMVAPNTSLAVSMLFQLVKTAGRLLGDLEFDIEILERHHRVKKDAPSNTAMHIAKLLQEALGSPWHVADRAGGETKPGKEIGVHAIRVGDNVGEHTLICSTQGETLELTHRAHSRDCYARGALQAAKYIASRPAGRYTMADVLGV